MGRDRVEFAHTSPPKCVPPNMMWKSWCASFFLRSETNRYEQRLALLRSWRSAALARLDPFARSDFQQSSTFEKEPRRMTVFQIGKCHLFGAAFAMAILAASCGAFVGVDDPLFSDAGVQIPANPGNADAALPEEAQGPRIPNPPVAPSPDGTCNEGRKKCGDLCVSVLDPAFGCADNLCAPCSIPYGEIGRAHV